MIELEINGIPKHIEAASIEELEQAIGRPIPPGHGVYRVFIDGRPMSPSELSPHELGRVRHVRVESAPLGEIASDAVGETIEWIPRICGVLDSIANDYRLGRDSQATGRLPGVADALQVLVHLLHHMNLYLEASPEDESDFKAEWERAQVDLRRDIDGLASDLALGDPIQLADRVGYAIPRDLGRFQELLERVKS